MSGPPSPSPAVSVVIPAFNRAGPARAAAESVLRQSWEDLELIVVDDGSSDGTAEAVEAIGDPRLRVIRHAANAGANAARNTGIEAARADWVAFQDSDDEWLPEKLARQMARLSSPPPPNPDGHGGGEWTAVYCGLARLDRDPATGRTTLDYVPWAGAGPLEGDVSGALLAGNFVSTQTLVARRAALIEAGMFDPAMPALQDWDMALRLSRLGPFAFVDEPLVLQRFSDDSLTRFAAKRLAGFARILEKNEVAFAARPALLADHARRIALGHARLGDRAAAKAWARRSWAAKPLAGGLAGWGRLMRALIRPSALPPAAGEAR